MATLEERFDNIVRKRFEFVRDNVKGLEAEVILLQERLLSLLVEDYIGRFKVSQDGTLLQNKYNYALANSIEIQFNKFNREFHEKVTKEFARNLLKTVPLSAEFYRTQGFDSAVINNLVEKMGFLQERIGIDIGRTLKSSKIIKGSYLDKLTQSQQVRDNIKNYILNSVSERKNYQTYLKGLKTRIVGNAQTDGRLQRYYSQYAYDSFNTIQSTADLFMADNLGLDFFIYEGSLIKTSRDFCIKRAGKVYSRKDTENWKCDPTLIGKPKGVKCDPSYNPFIERGRWNCRHQINWISTELACEMENEEACKILERG